MRAHAQLELAQQALRAHEIFQSFVVAQPIYGRRVEDQHGLAVAARRVVGLDEERVRVALRR